MRLVIALSLLVSLVGGAQGAILDSTFSTASTFVQSNNPSSGAKGNPPGTGFLEIKNRADGNPIPDWNRKAYIGFDLADLDDAPAYTLDLTFVDSGKGETVVGGDWDFSVYAFVNPNTNFNNMTWNNAPQNNVTSASTFLAGATKVASFSVSEMGLGSVWIQDDRLNDFVDANSNSSVIFAIGRDTASPPSYVHAVSAHGGSNPPILKAVPAPSVLLGMLSLITTGSAGYFFRKRRRK